MPLASSWLAAIAALAGGSLLTRKYGKYAGTAVLVAGFIWSIVSFSTSSPKSIEAIGALPVWETNDPVSKVFVMDDIPPTSGSLAAGKATVPDDYLTDPAIDTLLAMMEKQDIYLHRTPAQPAGVAGSDNIVVIKGNFQWTSRNTTSTDRIKGLIWQILQHPDGFTGEILICDNTQDVGTGINDADNNSEDPAQSIMDVVDTFAAKGYPVHYLDWRAYWDTVVTEYAEGDQNDGFVYEDDTKISYPKFLSPSGDYAISMRHGFWNASTETYDSERLCIIDFPVLKAHVMAGATIAVKNWIGMLTTAYSQERFLGWERMHYVYFFGYHATVARLMAVTYPRLIILDAAWTSTINPNDLNYLVNTNMLLASTDPVAVSWYAARYILTPIAEDPANSDPDLLTSRYRNTLRNWSRQLNNEGFTVTRDSSEISVYDRTVLVPPAVGVEREDPGVSTQFRLLSNYPNPFRTKTNITLELHRPTSIALSIYDTRGRLVRSITRGEIREPGTHDIEWDGTDDAGLMVGTGMYFLIMDAGGTRRTRSLVLVR